MVSPSAALDRAGPAAGRSPDVVVIILNWNGRDDTLDCLQSVVSFDYAAFHVIVVDNGSQDDSVEAIREAYPDIKIIETGRNLGFAEGNNVGMREALDSDYILLLNNDTTVAPDLLKELVAFSESDPQTAVSGPTICYADQRDKVWCAGLQIGRGSSYGIAQEYASSVLMYNGRPVDEVPAEVFEVDAVMGCAMFLRTRVLREIGLFDASLFMIHEDFDLSLRARASGYRCVTVPFVGVWHRVSSSIQLQERQHRGNPVSVYYWYRNWLVIVRKHFGRKAMLSVMFLYAFRLFPMLVLRSVLRFDCSPTLLSAYILALTDACTGTLKPRFVR